MTKSLSRKQVWHGLPAREDIGKMPVPHNSGIGSKDRASFTSATRAIAIAFAFANSISIGCAAPASRVPTNPWHLDLAFRSSHTRLASTKQQLDRRLELPLKLDVFGVFDRPYSPIDRKTDLGLTTWYAGVGREENTHLVWTYYVGAGAGKDINHQRFFNQTLEVDFRYGYYYTGITAEYYPWEVPAVPAAPSWEQRFRTSRPFLLAGFESAYVSAEGEGDYTVSGVNAYHDEQKIRDWLFSCLFGIGWALPLDDHWSINLSGDYKFHFYRPEEYNGWNVTTALRYQF